MKAAVLDLGTNTFNLKIAEIENNKIVSVIYNKKIPSKIGLGGINKAIISEDAFKRGIDALIEHKKTIDSFGVEKILAFGTSALRNASNSNDFVREVKETIGIDIKVISGDEEAELIYHGNRLAFEWQDECYLIMDIGGGSNEFIIADNNGVKWKRSYELGVSRLLQKFTPDAPMPDNQYNEIVDYINEQLGELYSLAQKYNVKTLIGSSGSFDTFRSMLEHRTGTQITDNSAFRVSLDEYQSVRDEIMRSTIDEIRDIKGMDPSRVEMIALACLLIDCVLEKCNLSSIIQSNYSLKEGAFALSFQ